MKKACISFLILIIVACIFNSFCEVYAFDYGIYTGNITSQNAKDGVTNITSTVLNVIRYAGTGIALIMLTMIFIKYMLSAASERAELKKNLVPFTIGTVVLFAASNLVGILKSVADGMFNGGSGEGGEG